MASGGALPVGIAVVWGAMANMSAKNDVNTVIIWEDVRFIGCGKNCGHIIKYS